MAQAPRSGTLEETLRVMKLLFSSAALTAEVNAVTSTISTSNLWTVTDATGATYPLDSKDTFAADLSWVHTAFARVAVTDGLSVGADNPTLLLFGQPGQVARTVEGGEYRLDPDEMPHYEYLIDGAVITYGTDPEATEREAMILADACDRLVQRNPHLGGLVLRAESVGPATPASVPKAGGTYGGALVRWRVTAQHPLA